MCSAEVSYLHPSPASVLDLRSRHWRERERRRVGCPDWNSAVTGRYGVSHIVVRQVGPAKVAWLYSRAESAEEVLPYVIYEMC